MLTCYQILRTAMTDATSSLPGADPDRASFTTADQQEDESVPGERDVG